MTQYQSSESAKAVLVTGCSSGIGRATAVYLARHGFTVFATVRKESDAQALRDLNEPTLVPICPLDFSKPQDIANAAEAVKNELSVRHINGLYGIVNNAGGGGIAPIELMDIAKFRVELEARILGPIALLQASLPLIREAWQDIVDHDSLHNPDSICVEYSCLRFCRELPRPYP